MQHHDNVKSLTPHFNFFELYSFYVKQVHSETELPSASDARNEYSFFTKSNGVFFWNPQTKRENYDLNLGTYLAGRIPIFRAISSFTTFIQLASFGLQTLRQLFKFPFMLKAFCKSGSHSFLKFCPFAFVPKTK